MVVLSAEEVVGHIQDIPHLPDALRTLHQLAAEAVVDRRTPHILDYTPEREYETETSETVVEIVDDTSSDDDGGEEQRGYRE